MLSEENTHTHARTHARTHAHTQTQTQTQTHTHTLVLGRYRQFFRNAQIGVSVIPDYSMYCIQPKNLEWLSPKNNVAFLEMFQGDVHNH